MKSDLTHITDLFETFRNEREWQQYNSPKDLAISLVLEANELLELFQWKNDEQSKRLLEERPESLQDEIADVICWVLLIAREANIDLVKAVENKMVKNRLKYPIEKCKGKTTKYTAL